MLYLSQNGPIATKRKANISIELQGFKCDHQVWPWPRHWPWIFKVKYGISYIVVKSGPIATKWKANILIQSAVHDNNNNCSCWEPLSKLPWNINSHASSDTNSMMQLGKGESLNLWGTNVILVSKFPIIGFWNYELSGGTKPLLETITFYD